MTDNDKAAVKKCQTCGHNKGDHGIRLKGTRCFASECHCQKFNEDLSADNIIPRKRCRCNLPRIDFDKIGHCRNCRARYD